MSRAPDYIVKAMNKTTDQKQRIGVGWNGKGGSISIVLNMLTVVTSDPNIVITLFPNDMKEKEDE